MPHTPERPASQAADRPATPKGQSPQPPKAKKPKGGPNKRQRATRAQTRVDWAPAYLSALAKCGQKMKAYRAARKDAKTVWTRRMADPEFAQAEQEAMKIAGCGFESEAVRRAVDGIITETRYDAVTGKKVMERRTFSDTILLRLLVKNETGSWRDSAKVEHAGAVDFTQMTRAERMAKLEEARRAGKEPL